MSSLRNLISIWQQQQIVEMSEHSLKTFRIERWQTAFTSI